ncbi:MAG: DUF5615 family PIN-like protein [Nanoarchaeota archaeon]|nr:DUF5615 family PIN-like protein [Nanoarchaeota archaeon]MCG2724176.1 DUF5615 family PIN-like protein [archaeon]
MELAQKEKYSNEMPPNAYSLTKKYIDSFKKIDCVVDACVSAELVKLMRENGKNVLYMAEIDALTGGHLSDNDIINIANSHNIPVITFNIPHFLGCVELIPLKATSVKRQFAVISSYE